MLTVRPLLDQMYITLTFIWFLLNFCLIFAKFFFILSSKEWKTIQKDSELDNANIMFSFGKFLQGFKRGLTIHFSEVYQKLVK